MQTGKGAPRNGTDDTPPTDTIPMLLEVPKIQVYKPFALAAISGVCMLFLVEAHVKSACLSW